MLGSIEGVYKNGKVELLDEPAGIREARVIVTFLPSTSPEPSAQIDVDLRTRGIDEQRAAELRRKPKAFAEDWEREDMFAYDALLPGRRRARVVSKLQPAHGEEAPRFG